MFNSYSNNQSFNFDINAVSGTLRKSHPKSKMMIRALKDNMYCFDEIVPRVKDGSGEIIILQTMLIGDNKALIEYVNKKDFEEHDEKIEASIYIVLIIEPSGSQYQVYTEYDKGIDYITGFVEYAVRKLFPEYSDIEFRSPEDIYKWEASNKDKLGNNFKYAPAIFSYMDGKTIYSASCNEHMVPININKIE